MAEAGMTDQEVRDLPVSIDLMTAAKALGISRSEAYSMVQGGRFPVATYRVGTRYRVARGHLLKFLGMDDAPTTPIG